MAKATKRTSKRQPKSAKPYTLPKGKVLVMRTSGPNGEAYGGFVWPKAGVVKAPDWKPTKACGHGLHGLLWGVGDAGYLNHSSDARWYVVEVDAKAVVDISRKVKFPTCKIVLCSDRKAVADLISKHAPAGSAIVCGTATAGEGGTATAGDRGTATAGYRGTATAGYGGTATAGDRGTATAGEGGTATAGDRGTATAGDRGTATAGDRGTATAGEGGTATAGDRGTATAGEGGAISIEYYDPARSAYRRIVSAIGDAGIKPKTKYRVVDCKLVEVK